MRKLWIGTITIALLALGSCSDDDKSVTDPTPCTECETLAAVISFQDSCETILLDLIAVLDSTSAKDSVAAIARRDPLVSWSGTSSQGVLIEYAEGGRGFLILDYLDTGPEDDLPSSGALEGSNDPYRSGTQANAMGTESDHWDIPTSKTTALVMPLYSEKPIFQRHGTQILERYGVFFPRAGFSAPAFYPDTAANFSVIKSLDQFGIVHLYTHGAKWEPPVSYAGPIDGRVYMMTGEKARSDDGHKTWDDWKKGHIVIVNDDIDRRFYAVDDFWMTRENDFSTHSTLVYGAFCFGWLHGWEEAMNANVGDGAYIGFDGESNAQWETNCADSLFNRMSNRTLDEPVTIGGWVTNPGGASLEYNGVHLHRTGNADLALWRPESVCENFPPPPGEELTYQVVDTPYSFTTIIEEVSEEIGGYTVYRARTNDNPPGLGLYTGCDGSCGEVDVATDWWELGNPNNHGRYFYLPPLVYLCAADTAVGASRNWSGTFGDSPGSQTTEIVARESVTIPLGTYPDAVKILVTSTGSLEDDPIYFWFTDEYPGPIKGEVIPTGETIVLVAYQGPGAGAVEVTGGLRSLRHTPAATAWRRVRENDRPGD